MQDLTLTADGTFSRLNNVVCNAQHCPAFKIGVNEGSYRVYGDTIRFDGNLYDFTAVLEGDDDEAIEIREGGSAIVLHPVPEK
ncbi:hypothetical protein [Streptomyces sp. NPDC089799]|uniref:hypothetical protein n=1 Tax=Streptomyces sp. NPDC089799 TaxID=3155066 RepID=UPI0034265ECF